MPIVPQAYRLTPIHELQPHPDNPRKGDIGAINESVETNGFYGAVVAQQSTGYVLAGNHRLLVAEAQGITTLPVIWVDVNDEQARRILTVDNRSNDLADWDDRKLAELLGEMPDLTGSGFTDEDLETLMRSTGMLGEAATAFLDGFRVEDDTDDGQADDGPVVRVDGGSEQYFTVAYTVTAEQRESIFTAIRVAKAAGALPTAAAALAAVCQQYLDAPVPEDAG